MKAMMNRKEIERGIAAYAYEQRVLLRLIRFTGGLTEEKFDRLFSGREWRKPKLRPHKIDGDSFILGGIFGGRWAWWLDLLQHMMAVGLVDTRRDSNGSLVYIIP